jgi:hypothetical protein
MEITRSWVLGLKNRGASHDMFLAMSVAVQSGNISVGSRSGPSGSTMRVSNASPKRQLG